MLVEYDSRQRPISFVNVTGGLARSFVPGDIVRPQLFEDDADLRGHPPVGLVTWCRGSCIGVLWSGDPSRWRFGGSTGL